MNELSLFTGAGGGVYASKLLGHRVVGYVEWNDYCQRVIAQRIQDGIFDEAPIFGDIRAFVCAGYAERYRGMVDVVSGGFPCQPFSVAGAGLGVDDERNMWPATRDVLDAVRPRYCFLENVPGLASNGYIGTVLGDLASLGYDAEWTVLGADDCGAPHRRKRLWILGHLADASSRRRGQQKAWQVEQQGRAEAVSTGAVPDAESLGRNARGLPERAAKTEPVAGVGSEVGHANRARLEEREGIAKDDGQEQQATERAGLSSWWQRDPADGDAEQWGAIAGLGRVASGIPNRRHRLEALGNAQVPAVAAAAFRLLMSRAAQRP